MIEREALLGMRRIASRANTRVKDWAGLELRAARAELGLTLAVGARLAAEGLAPGPGWTPDTLVVADRGAAHPLAAELHARASAAGVACCSVSDDVYDKIAGFKNGDGLALVMRWPVDAALPAAGGRWLAAAGVQDPGNAGALARTALAAGMDGCVFVEGADPVSPKFLRGSMGAAFRLPCVRMEPDAFADACTAGRFGRVLAAWSGPGAADYRTADYSAPHTILLGGERGIPDTMLRLAAQRIHIPLAGGVESLNLAVAAGVILFHAAQA